jgi:[CysO sulfur-carrier protein]-S-L-cysteine hydrolase
MLNESRRDSSLECCGLLAGRDGAITAILPVRNVNATPAIAYEIAPNELFELFREIRAQGLELLGIYHSHPTSENSPSPTDIDRAFYPEVAHFIISPLPNAKTPVRAFRIRNASAQELIIEIVE